MRTRFNYQKTNTKSERKIESITSNDRYFRCAILNTHYAILCIDTTTMLATTRMHSSSMRTASSSSCPGGSPPGTSPGADPLGADPPEQTLLGPAPPPPGSGPPSRRPAARHARIPPTMHAGIAHTPAPL